MGDGCLRALIFRARRQDSTDLGELVEKYFILVKEFWAKLTSNQICVYLLGIIGVFVLIFVGLIVALCAKNCCTTRKTQLSFNNSMRRVKQAKQKKNANANDFTNLLLTAQEHANAPPQPPPEDMNSSKQQHSHLETESREAQKSNLQQEAPRPVVENEFQILRKQLMSNMRHSGDDYENVYNNIALKKAHKYKY